MARPETKIEIRGDILRELISAKAIQLNSFGEQLGVTRQTVHSWISDSKIPPRRLLDVRRALGLTTEDFAKLTKRASQEVRVQFRTARDVPVPESVKLGVEEVAQEFLRLDTSKIDRRSIRATFQAADASAMAESIVGQLGLSRHLSLESTVLALEAQNIHVAFHDFGPEFVASNAQAACANLGDKSLIFINSYEAVEDVLWRIFHEACHLFAGHSETTKVQERFCDEVANEIVTPSTFFLQNKEVLKHSFKGRLSRAPLVVKELAHILSAGFSGVIIALKANKIIETETEKYLWGCFHKMKASRPLVLSRIKPKETDDQKQFWLDALNDPERAKFLKFQTLVQKALIEERISIARAAEILGTDEKTAEELAVEWTQLLNDGEEKQG